METYTCKKCGEELYLDEIFVCPECDEPIPQEELVEEAVK
jgi:hypothetical protein